MGTSHELFVFCCKMVYDWLLWLLINAMICTSLDINIYYIRKVESIRDEGCTAYFVCKNAWNSRNLLRPLIGSFVESLRLKNAIKSILKHSPWHNLLVINIFFLQSSLLRREIKCGYYSDMISNILVQRRARGKAKKGSQAGISKQNLQAWISSKYIQECKAIHWSRNQARTAIHSLLGMKSINECHYLTFTLFCLLYWNVISTTSLSYQM